MDWIALALLAFQQWLLAWQVPQSDLGTLTKDFGAQGVLIWVAGILFLMLTTVAGAAFVVVKGIIASQREDYRQIVEALRQTAENDRVRNETLKDSQRDQRAANDRIMDRLSQIEAVCSRSGK